MAVGPINKEAVTEIDVIWITAGLGCDGDTIARTAATQPSIEDVLLGQIPWILKVNLHNPFLALANGDHFTDPDRVIAVTTMVSNQRCPSPFLPPARLLHRLPLATHQRY